MKLIHLHSILAAAWLASVVLGRATPASGIATASAPSSAPVPTRADTSPEPAPAARPRTSDAQVADDPVLAELRARLDGARGAQKAKDFAGARTKIEEAIGAAVEALANREDPRAGALLDEMAVFARDAGALRAAETAQRTALDLLSRTLPDDHERIQEGRANLALCIRELGDLERARELQELVLEVRSRTLSPDRFELQTARLNLGATLLLVGDSQRARELSEQVVEVFSRTLPDDHPMLQLARQNLAQSMKDQGDLRGALPLEEQVLEVRLRKDPDDDPDLQIARANLATTLHALGDLERARALQVKVLEVFSATLPDDHINLQAMRFNLAGIMRDLGDVEGARALQERSFSIYMRTLPDDHPNVQIARVNLAGTRRELGDLQGARALEERALDVFARTLPDDHRYVQAARQGLAMTLEQLGDLEAARTLQERVLEVRSRTLPDDHPELQTARQNLAVTIKQLGDLQRARSLEEQVLAVRSATLRDDHPNLQQARLNLANTIGRLGDLEGARALDEKVLEVRCRTLPDEHPDVQKARASLAWTIADLRAVKSGASDGDASVEQQAERERCSELMLSICRAQTNAAREALLSSSAREAQAQCESLAVKLGDCLSFAGGCGVFEPIPSLERACFTMSETTRGAALGAAALMRQAARAPRHAELRGALQQASDELAALVQQGATREEFQAALTRRDAAQRELVTLARGLSGGAPPGLDFDVDALAAGLADRQAIVGFRRYARTSLQPAPESNAASTGRVIEESVTSLCAFVLRHGSDGTNDVRTSNLLTRVELGPIAAIEQAVQDWRESLGVAATSRGVPTEPRARDAIAHDAIEARGRALRRLVFDPLLPALEGVDHVVLALDDVLHLVPLDALPMDADSAAGTTRSLLGDRWRIEVRATLAERLALVHALDAGEELVAVGGVSYDAPAGATHAGAGTIDSPDASATAGAAPHAVVAASGDSSAAESSRPRASTPPTLALAASRADDDAGILRGGAWSGGFQALPASAAEVEAIARELREQRARTAATLLVGADATRERLLELAPKARWLHIATHGWFAPESIRSWSDPAPIGAPDRLPPRASGDEQVRGMSPMLLCGLALAGASSAANELGRVPGLITAEEIAALDLSNCELAVLSACDTNVGVHRAGQGVASLQMALQMAGARSVITSLWKVPDDATRALMTDFYRRLWTEKKPKWQALREAKQTLREAKDERGALMYTTRDWAAWVLTGDPN